MKKLLFGFTLSSKIVFLFIFVFLFFKNEIIFSQIKKNNSQSVKSKIIQSKPKIISFELLTNGDTINQSDEKNNRLGFWLIVNKPGYGEPSTIEYGKYDNNIKSGVWKSYTIEGKIISTEFFKKGNRSGEARYYEDGYLYCIGNYLALNNLYDYDTILVEDPITNIEKPVIIKTDVGSVRHGYWTYYEPPSTEIKKIVEYQADEIIYEKEYITKADSVYLLKRMKLFPHINRNSENEKFILQLNKKPPKYTDFPDDVEYVKPNIRK